MRSVLWEVFGHVLLPPAFCHTDTLSRYHLLSVTHMISSLHIIQYPLQSSTCLVRIYYTVASPSCRNFDEFNCTYLPFQYVWRRKRIRLLVSQSALPTPSFVTFMKIALEVIYFFVVISYSTLFEFLQCKSLVKTLVLDMMCALCFPIFFFCFFFNTFLIT